MQICRLAAVLLCAAVAPWASGREEDRKHPEPIEAPLPSYPAELRDARIEGRVEVVLFINKEGRVENADVVKSTDARLERGLADTLKSWSFHPATDDLKPVSSARFISIEFKNGLVSAGLLRSVSAFDVPPKPLKRVTPPYPKELVDTGNTGKVVIRFIVDEEGLVRNPKVMTSTHPAFEGPAVAALLLWKFSPASSKGTPVPVLMELPVSFNFTGSGETEAFEIDGRQRHSTPEEFKFDTPPKPRVTVFAVHPYDDAVAQKAGSAKVGIIVGPDGRVLASHVVSASKPEFGLALVAVLEAWEFEPAKRGKDAVISGLTREQEFKTSGRDSAFDSETSRIAKKLRAGTFKPANPRELDKRLSPTFIAPLVYPTALDEKGIEGSAKIEVIIDRRGKAILPRIVEASAPEFGWAAATAVQRWLFEPPTVGGKPVEIRVQIPFSFSPPEEDVENAK